MLNQISAPFQRDDGIQDRDQQSGVTVATKITPKCWSRENLKVPMFVADDTQQMHAKCH
jgi:hypothetical protein